jgi:hypothetical protein
VEYEIGLLYLLQERRTESVGEEERGIGKSKERSNNNHCVDKSRLHEEGLEGFT